MDLAHLFEDLEAQFDAEKEIATNRAASRKSALEGPILLQISLADETKFTLVAPTLGLDFVAGVNQETSALTVIALASVLNLVPIATSNEKSHELRISGLDLAEFCQVFVDHNFQIVINFRDANRVTRSGWLVGQKLTILEFADSMGSKFEFIPVATISRIETFPVHN